MPRLPVDGKKVIEHRITFGTKERDLIQQISNTYRIGQVAGPTVEVLKDATALYSLAVVFELITGQELPFVITPEEAGNFWFELYTYNKRNREEKAASATGGVRLVIQDFFTVFNRLFSGDYIQPGGN